MALTISSTRIASIIVPKLALPSAAAPVGIPFSAALLIILDAISIADNPGRFTALQISNTEGMVANGARA